jgi:hypothetical protein
LSEPLRRGRESAAAEQPYLRLLVGCKAERSGEAGHGSRDKAAIVAPREGDIGRESLPLIKLVLHLRRLLERLIVVDAEYASGQVRVEEQSTRLGREEACACVPGDEERRQPVIVGKVSRK